MAHSNFRSLRILILLLILLAVAGGEYLTRVRSTDWDDSLWVVVYPINADNSQATDRYIQTLDEQTFKPIERFMLREAKRFKLTIDQPVTIKLAAKLNAQPPQPPQNGNILSVMLWSLHLRYWAYKHDQYSGPKDIQMFVRYFDPKTTQRVAHSLGLQKGMLGIVNAFASQRQNAQNNIIIAHEMLHTVGASDKYDLTNNQPLYPIGYADPDNNPLWPQTRAEIMGGRIPLSETESEIPKGLKSVMIGKHTALEIRWIQDL